MQIYGMGSASEAGVSTTWVCVNLRVKVAISLVYILYYMSAYLRACVGRVRERGR